MNKEETIEDVIRKEKYNLNLLYEILKQTKKAINDQKNYIENLEMEQKRTRKRGRK